jgi:phage recombination protein Bet
MKDNKPKTEITELKTKKESPTKEYHKLIQYVGDWNGEVGKIKILGNIHRNILGVDKVGRLRPYHDLAFFMLLAKQYNLNPLKNEIYATYQKTGDLEKLIPIVSIHGLRALARRAKNPTYAYTGKARIDYKDDKIDSATVEVFGYFGDPRSGIVKVGEYTAYFEEFVRYKKDGTPNKMWTLMPKVMLIKCAEANALRMAFNISGIYIEEEINDGDSSIIEDETIAE